MRQIIAMEHPIMAITQAQLAEMLGSISQPTMNAYESGYRRMPLSTLQALARALGVSIEDLLGENECRYEEARPRAETRAAHGAH